MYGPSGFGGFFGSSVHGMGLMPMHSGVLNNPRINRKYFMDNGAVNMHCPVRKVLCGELRLQDAGFPVEICGRIQNQRLGRFLSLRDDTGITQLVVPDDRIDMQKRLRNTPLNSFLVLRGFVTARPDKSRNEKMATGDIEVLIENLVSVHPKRKKEDSDSDDEDIKRRKKKASINSASLKLTSEELSKCPTPTLIKHFSQRTHTCGELSKRLVGKNITLCGWVSAKRVGRFVMLKDGYGSVQIVPEIQNTALTNKFQNLHINSILVVKGVVSRRPPGHENPRVENGNIEVLVESLTVINPQEPPSPKDLKGGGDGGEGDDSGTQPDMLIIKQDELDEKKEQSVPNPNKYCSRTHTCGELNVSNVGQKVQLVGWIEFRRMDKFIVLRDKYGKIQLIMPDSRPDLQRLVETLPLESVISVEGTVCSRPPGQENIKQKTGFIEVSVTDLKLLGRAKSSIPFVVRDTPTESVRLKYRYLDLRFENMQRNLRFRSTTVHKMRRFLVEHLDFLEVETPTLSNRTPGGANEFLVPTKTEDEFYSLVQSPQIFKQLLMVGSVDRYFQFARCYRDESYSPERQPEFTQLDLEMSFCDREGIINLVEELLRYCLDEDIPFDVPFPRITYEEAMNSYGTDKPDTRFDWKIQNLTGILEAQKDNCKGKLDVKKILDENNFAVHAFVGCQGRPKFSNTTRKSILEHLENQFPSTKVYFFPVTTVESTKQALESLFCESVADEIGRATKYDKHDVLFLAIGPKMEALESLGKIRLYFAEYLKEKNVEVIPNNTFKFLWVVDFPLFLKTEDKIESCHHPFTQPHPDDINLLETEPLKVRSLHYDLVLNGREVGGGSIRINDAEVQQKVLEKILNINTDSLSYLLDALASGAPPHGGIALGLDRLVAILCGCRNIKDVIAFPKGRKFTDLMTGAPCSISNEEKKQYHIKISS